MNFSVARQDTEVHWTQSEKDPLEETGLRGHLVALRRLMMVMQEGLELGEIKSPSSCFYTYQLIDLCNAIYSISILVYVRVLSLVSAADVGAQLGALEELRLRPPLEL